MCLMDVNMPICDGIAASRFIKSHSEPYMNQIPIIAVTAHVFQAEKEKCQKAGMSDFLPKPFTLKQLIRILKTWSNKTT